VWLNVIGSDRTLEDADHLAENPQRVDFALFAEGEKAVVEIDGRSHYAAYDVVTKTYSINEERYAKNLAIERSLRRQGWDIHRFSNLEVERANSDEQFVHLAQACLASSEPRLWVAPP
jgi:very-short-patch-repair endonuclease